MATKKNETTNKSSSDKQKALDFAVSFLEKQFGKGTLMRLGDKPHVEVGAISTGSLAIDVAIGIGGLPKGRVIEIYGPESSGKTTLTLNLIAEAQKAGGNCAFVDAEHALDPEYAEKLGVNLQDLLISQPDDGEQALEIVDSLVRSGAIDVLIVDSVAALTPRQEIEGDMDQLSVGLQARLMSKALRKITASVSKTGCMVVFINQIRMKIGGYGNPETTTGGNALKFYSSVRLEIRRGKAIMKGEEPVGTEANVKIVKNKVAPPFKKAEIEILFGRGISKESELVSLGAKYDILQKSGSWYSYNGDKIGQGKDNVRLYLIDKPELAKEIQDKIMAKVKGVKTEDSEKKTENEQEN